MAKKSRATCRRELDTVICDLKAKRERVAFASTVHDVVRGYGDKKSEIEKYPYSCIRVEHGARGGDYYLINHDHSFKKWAKWVVNLTHPQHGQRGGHVQHYSLAPTVEDTYCYQRNKRASMLAGTKRKR